MTTQFVPTASISNLSKAVCAALSTSSELLEIISNDLSETQHSKIAAVMRAGGRIGIELCVNAHGVPSVCLVMIEREGTRRVLVEVATVNSSSTLQ
ncbi:hypothetical protein [Collimonas humicola]|uniref:hypothetical protein n=1 Tax=Collimonas humicola TaxID=2825886 RepID=UPI001B8AE678|nr:hypothetical protein [Collimonas humicola]